MDIRIDVFENNCTNEFEVCAVEGRIYIADYEETLYIPLNWWSIDLYQQQWASGLARLRDYDRSCLVVMIDNPCCRKLIEWWLLYKIDDKIYIRNSILIEEIYEESIGDKLFTVNTCYDFIPDRSEIYNEDGNKISEWIIDWNG